MKIESEKIKCECGNVWKRDEKKVGYKGEVVLFCDKCGELYFNAQEWFLDEDLEALEYLTE
ncbi:MAG TPA: hypothetical protein PLA71_00560 [Saccharofermentans sp.]|nr:hypothetical protein [Saccharofermentans sp.]